MSAPPHPASLIVTLSLDVPEGSLADTDRLGQALAGAGYPDVHIPLSVLRKLPSSLSLRSGIRATLVQNGRDWTVVDIGPLFPLAVAVDIGSTNIAAALVNPADGRIVAEGSMENPQVPFSADILDRALHSRTRMEELHPPLVSSIDSLVRTVCRQAERIPSDVVCLVASGNTLMGHLLLGIEATALPVVPNTPVFHRVDPCRAREIGFESIHPEALIHIVPNMGAFVGGDILAGLQAVGFGESEGVSLFVDVGTNAEVALGCRDWILVGAGAAGPALESGISGHGGRAQSGAIERVRWDEVSARWECRTIGNAPASHLCGSGLIDAVHELYHHGLVDGRGRFTPRGEANPGFHPADRLLTIVPAVESATGRPIGITEKDIDNFIRSKAGMYALVSTLLVHVGLSASDVDRVYVAGAFGNSLEAAKLMKIGMLPPLDRAEFIASGNTSLQGAINLVRDRSGLEVMERIRRKITYLDMNTDPSFMREFSRARFLPHTDGG